MDSKFIKDLPNDTTKDNPAHFGKLFEDAHSAFNRWVEQRKQVADSTYTANLQYAFAARGSDDHDVY